MQDFARPVASSVMPRAARGPSLRRGQGILPHRRWVGAPAAVSWSVLPPGVGTIHEWWHCGLANTPSRRTAESPMCRWACCRARCHSHRPVSQSGRTGVGCARRQHFTNLATLTSPISAYTVVFATNGSGGGDAKAAAGTAMRDARMSSSHVEGTTRCCCRRGQRGRRGCCLYLLMRPRQAQNFCCGPVFKGKFALSCFEQ